MKLAIGNKVYSSWSLRPWILMRALDIPFEEDLIPLDTPEFRPRVNAYGAGSTVPILVDGEITVWESLAIMEYLAERFPDKAVWPRDLQARAFASLQPTVASWSPRMLRGFRSYGRRRSPGSDHWAAGRSCLARFQQPTRCLRRSSRGFRPTRSMLIAPSAPIWMRCSTPRLLMLGIKPRWRRRGSSPMTRLTRPQLAHSVPEPTRFRLKV